MSSLKNSAFLRQFGLMLGLATLAPSVHAVCDDVSVSLQAGLEAAIVDYNTNCAAGQTMTVTVDGTITLGSALSVINNATTAVLEIVGDGDDVLDGAGSFRIFNLNDGNLHVDTMTLQNGSNTEGGAIRNFAGSLTVTDSVLAGNTASNVGGAINMQLGSISVIDNTTFANNVSGTSGTSGGGGAINNGNGTLTVSNSTFSGNAVLALGFSGGAIQAFGGSATNAIVNSTFSGNSSRNVGGAIITAASLALTNSTFSDNQAPGGGGAVSTQGSSLALNNTILANSTTDGSTATTDCLTFGSTIIFSAGLSNLIEQGSGCGTPGGDFIQADPVLGMLADNGGAVETMAPGAGSPVINAGNNAAAAALLTDARGAGFPRQVAGAVDLGAVENQQSTSVEFVSATGSGAESLPNPALLTLSTSDGQATVVPIMIELAVLGGTVMDDFTATTPFTIPAGTANATPFAIPGFAIVDDTDAEPNETLTLTLSNPSQATLGAPSTMNYMIEDNDTIPSPAPPPPPAASPGSSATGPSAIPALGGGMLALLAGALSVLGLGGLRRQRRTR